MAERNGRRARGRAAPQTEPTSQTDPGASPDGHGTAQPAAQGPSCNVAFCPICLAVTAIGSASPELVEHLLLAGREMLLALRAVIDQRLEGSEEKPERRVQRISIE